MPQETKLQTYKSQDTWKPGDALTSAEPVTKEEVHERKLLHLSVHLLMRDHHGSILCRKRGADEQRYSGLWTSTIGVHVVEGGNYITTLLPLLPRSISLQFVGEFRVLDLWENEVNGLFCAVIGSESLPIDFLRDREFLTPQRLQSLVQAGLVTPHLREAFKFVSPDCV